MSTIIENEITFENSVVQKKIKSFTKDLKSAWGDSLTVSKGESPSSRIVVIGTKKYGLSMVISVENNVLHSSNLYTVGTSYPEDYLKKAFKFLFGLSRTLNLDKVEIVIEYEDEKKKELFFNSGFERVLVPLVDEETWREHDIKYTMDMMGGNFHTLRDWSGELQRISTQIRKDDSSFRFNFLNSKASHLRYSYYYKGVEDVICIKTTSEGIQLLSEKVDANITLHNIENLKVDFIDLLDMCFSKMRLHNAINPPRKYFDEFVKRELPADKQNINRLFEFLLQFHDALDVELHISKKDYISRAYFERSNEEIRFFQILDCYVLFTGEEKDENGWYTKDETLQLFEPSEKHLALKTYKELKLKRHEIYIDYEINEYFNDLN